MGAGVGGTTASGEFIVRTGEGATKPGHSLRGLPVTGSHYR